MEEMDIGFSCFNVYRFISNIREIEKLLIRSMKRLIQDQYTDCVCNRMQNQYRYPLICWNAIYGVNIGKIVHTAAYYVKDFHSFYMKRVALYYFLKHLLKMYIPWAQMDKPVKYEYYPYSNYINPQPLHQNNQKLIASIERIDTTGKFIVIKED